MDRAWLAPLAAGADILIAVAYAGAGALVVHRMRMSHERAAGNLFALWWFGIAATGLSSLLLHAAAGAGASPMTLDLVDQLSLVAYATALAGFVSYVAFIYFGSHRATGAIFAVFGALVAWSLAAALYTPATSYTLDGWVRDVERPENFGPPRALTAALLAAPALAAIAGYAALRKRAATPQARARVSLVTAALLAWLAGSAIASLPQLQGTAAAQLASRAAILLSAGLILAAYRPPGLLRAWWDPASHERRRALAARLEDRVRELV